jgi:hypothetical protein
MLPSTPIEVKRPACLGLPCMIWPIRVWAPTQPMVEARPPTICSANTAKSKGSTG